MRIARRLGLLEVPWSVDSADSLGASWAEIIQRVEGGLRSVSVPELLASDPPALTQLRRGWSGCGERPSPIAGNGA